MEIYIYITITIHAWYMCCLHVDDVASFKTIWKFVQSVLKKKVQTGTIESGIFNHILILVKIL